ncbi:toprim domain-containing protein, partial [Coprococcus sp. CLA-AA-H190]
GCTYHDRYERGVPTIPLEKGLLPVIGRTRKTGTTISFLPDKEIFEKTWFKEDEIKSRLHETAYLNPELTIIYEDKRVTPEEQEVYHEPDGLAGFIRDLNRNKEALHDIVCFKGESEGITIEGAFQYVNEFHENVLGFCNNIYNAEGGTHITGFKSAFTSIMNAYAREIGILKEKDGNFTGADIRNGMTAVISIKHPDPRFEGQTKTKLDNQDAARVTGKIVNEEVVRYFDKNLDTLKVVLSCAEKAAKIRKTEEKARTNLLTKQKFSFDSNGKLANCESRNADICEIFIVEGDSAGGSAKTARNRHFQAILPIRGKILNVEKASIDKILANAEIKTMINAFGCGFSEGYGNDFDISKLRYNKIIIMADADVDGAHISTLLLTLFYRFMPELIYEGHVYIAMPPLYKAMPSKGKEEYLYDDKALEQYRKTHKGNFTLQRYKGLGEMDAAQLWETTLNPETRILKKVEIEDARIASDITGLLMGPDVPPRKAFIYKHAHDAELDI